jgi:hypothetical protein
LGISPTEPEGEGTISFVLKRHFTTCSVMQQRHPKKLVGSVTAGTANLSPEMTLQFDAGVVSSVS